MMRAIVVICLCLFAAVGAQARPMALPHYVVKGEPVAFPLFIANNSGAAIQDPGPSQNLFNNPYYTCSTNLYISTTGNDTTGNGTSGNPWATFTKANNSVPTAGTCINAAPGTYSAGAIVSNGGNAATTNGYVVYRCQTIGGCTITDNGQNTCSFGGSPVHSAFAVCANYLYFDGFVFAASSFLTNGEAIGIAGSSSVGYNFSFHHIWATNNTVSGYGLSGFQWNQGEYFYVVHNTFWNNSQGVNCDSGAQGSGVSIGFPIPVSGYTPVSDDSNNKVTGNTGSLFRHWVMWNVFYNNRIDNACGSGNSTDGNGFIADTWNWNCHSTVGGQTGIYDAANCSAGSSVYTNGALVAFNVSYNNGGAGFITTSSPYITYANNSCYNSNLDTNNTGTVSGRACIAQNQGYANTIINNIAYAIGGSGTTVNNSGIAVGGTGNTITGTLSGSITNSTLTINETSNTNMPGASNGWPINGTYALPGGNIITIDSEQMLVCSWGATSITICAGGRGYYGSTAASHTNGATITWVQDYPANNITDSTGSSQPDFEPFNGNQYSTTLNKTGTLGGWVNVGNTSSGSISTQPNGTNFALSGGSPAIGYGQTSTNGQSFLSSQSADAGACYHTLGTCP